MTASFKVFGNAGRYALPLTATVAVRGASASLFSEEYYCLHGHRSDHGCADGPTQVINPILGHASATSTTSSASARIRAPSRRQNLEPMYQDEYILGFQKQLTEHVSLGVRGIYP